MAGEGRDVEEGHRTRLSDPTSWFASAPDSRMEATATRTDIEAAEQTDIAEPAEMDYRAALALQNEDNLGDLQACFGTY